MNAYVCMVHNCADRCSDLWPNLHVCLSACANKGGLWLVSANAILCKALLPLSSSPQFHSKLIGGKGPKQGPWILSSNELWRGIEETRTEEERTWQAVSNISDQVCIQISHSISYIGFWSKVVHYGPWSKVVHYGPWSKVVNHRMQPVYEEEVTRSAALCPRARRSPHLIDNTPIIYLNTTAERNWIN
jgi:hypothetical protein